MQLAAAGLDRRSGSPFEHLAPLFQSFFTDRLITSAGQRHTIASYRDTFRLLLGFAAEPHRQAAESLELADSTLHIAAFLDHLEHQPSQPCRPATTASPRFTPCSATARCDIPNTPRRSSGYWRSRPNAATATWSPGCPRPNWTHCWPHPTGPPGPDDATTRCWSAAQTGLRISELTGLTIADVHLEAGAYVHCLGKGRKERATPLTHSHTVAVLRVWLRERLGAPTDPAFPTRTGTRLSRDAVEHRLARHLASARASCPSLRTKRVGMHTLRHQPQCGWSSRAPTSPSSRSGSDTSSPPPPRADLPARRHEPETTSDRPRHTTGTTPGRYRAPDPLLAFLEAL